MIKGIVTSPVVALIVRLILGVIFLYSGIVKAADPAGFAQAVANYHILPDSMINSVAIMLPWVEIVTGGSLLLGVMIEGGALVSSLLFVIFAGALTINVMRGLDVACVCFSTSAEAASINGFYIVRDLILLAMAVHVLFCDRGLASLGSVVNKITDRGKA